jgi:acetyl esterase/lipase
VPSPELESVVELIRSTSPFQAGTLLEKRARMELQAGAAPLPADVRYEPVDAGGVPAEWTSAPGACPDAALLYFHGGGYCLGSIATHRALVARIARETGLRVLSVGYRLAPEHPHPAAVEDALAAHRFVLAQGVAPEHIAFAGDSAGGGLVLAALVAARDAKLPLPAAAACISPWTDLSASGDSVRTKTAEDPMITPADLAEFGAAYAGERLRAPTASPLFADLAGLPPLLLQVGTAELLLDDSLRLADAARRAGVRVELRVWDGMIHVWHAFADLLPEGAQGVRQLAAFLAKRLARQRGPSLVQ